MMKDAFKDSRIDMTVVKKQSISSHWPWVPMQLNRWINSRPC